jgi:hypothetical protein
MYSISDFFGNMADSIGDFFGSITDWMNDNLADGPWPAFLGVAAAVTICFVLA